MDGVSVKEIHEHLRSWPGKGTWCHLGHVITDQKQLKIGHWEGLWRHSCSGKAFTEQVTCKKDQTVYLHLGEGETGHSR